MDTYITAMQSQTADTAFWFRLAEQTFVRKIVFPFFECSPTTTVTLYNAFFYTLITQSDIEACHHLYFFN